MVSTEMESNNSNYHVELIVLPFSMKEISCPVYPRQYAVDSHDMKACCKMRFVVKGLYRVFALSPPDRHWDGMEKTPVSQLEHWRANVL